MPVYEEKITNDGRKKYFIRTYVKNELGKTIRITRRNKDWVGRDGYWLASQEEIRLIYDEESIITSTKEFINLLKKNV